MVISTSIMQEIDHIGRAQKWLTGQLEPPSDIYDKAEAVAFPFDSRAQLGKKNK